MNANQLLKLENILNAKDWSSDELFNSIKNKIGRLLSKLNGDEIDLFLELLNDFTWVRYNSYNKLMLDIFRSFDKQILETAKKFYFFPIVKPSDAYKIKSGGVVIYSTVPLLNHLEEFDTIEKEIVDNYKALKKVKLQDDEYLVLMDDFIGSGNALMECVNKLNELGFDSDNIMICSLVIQESGLKKIQEMGSKIFYSHIEKKGISDKFEGKERESRLERMRKIEFKLKFDKNFSLGYESSEALISMIKPPNNTFPVFWHEYIHEEKIEKAPFPRF